MSLHPSGFAPDFARASAYPQLAAAGVAIDARDWTGVRAIMESLDWAGRQSVAWEVAEKEWSVEFLHGVLAADPTDLYAAAVLGEALVEAGWRIRTGARAANVSREQFAALHDHLRRAERILIDVTARDPGNAVAWTARLTTARGLELGQNETRRRYDQCAKYTPNHLPAQRSLMQQLAPKWSGSFEAMHAFARECLTTSPEGSLNAAVIVDAHIEHWFDVTKINDRSDPDAQLKDEAARQEVRAAAARSIFHPAFTYPWGWVAVVSAFAAWFSRVNDLESAARCFRLLGPYAAERGWEFLYWKDPKGAFVENRAKAIAAVGGQA